MNPNTGKRERIYVDLATLYPTPDVPGSELSFEEVWARNRGWLDDTEEEADSDEHMQMDENSPQVLEDKHAATVDVISQRVTESLVIHRDADAGPSMYDENGAVREAPRAAKSKKVRRMEANETQISELLCPIPGVRARLAG
jgi:checkpoint serine/threonine-protein kinase